MSKEKQIEEMARDICRLACSCEECTYRKYREKTHKCAARTYAERAYKKNYRKQSEGEWIDKPTGAYGRMQSWCSACGKHSGIGGIESNRHKPFCPNCGAKMKGGAE